MPEGGKAEQKAQDAMAEGVVQEELLEVEVEALREEEEQCGVERVIVVAHVTPEIPEGMGRRGGVEVLVILVPLEIRGLAVMEQVALVVPQASLAPPKLKTMEVLVFIPGEVLAAEAREQQMEMHQGVVEEAMVLVEMEAARGKQEEEEEEEGMGAMGVSP